MDEVTSCAQFGGRPEAKASGASAIGEWDRSPLSIDEALNALKSGMWGDVRFIAFNKGTVTLLFEDARVVGYLEVFNEEGSRPSDGMFLMHFNVERQKGNRWSPFSVAQ